MGDKKTQLPLPIFRRDISWDPFPNWTQPNRIFAQDFGLPPPLEPKDLEWIDWAQKKLASFSRPGHAETAPNHETQPTSGASEVETGPNRWTIQTDVDPFSPEEITVTTNEGYLIVAGNHEDHRDEHGSVTRCFTRTYALPQGVDLQHMCSSLSADGVLSVEAPVLGTSISPPPSAIVEPAHGPKDAGR